MRISKIAKSPPYAVEGALKTLGQNIETARLRRKLSREALAKKIGISRYVMADVENGKPTTAIAAYIGALWALGLLETLKSAGDPDKDSEGRTLEAMRRPKTAPKRTRKLDDDF
jgi:ribosome-binding protein aMBF1 (putative translation factor)